MSCCTTTVSNSVLNSAPVGHASRHGALWQCLHTSLSISQPDWKGDWSLSRTEWPHPVERDGEAGSADFSTNAT